MKNTQEKKDNIVKYIDYLTEEQVNFIYNLTNLNSPNKRELLTLAGVTEDDQRKIDSATPQDYYNSIEAIYPNIDKGNMMYSYIDKSFGEMININDLIVKKILNLHK